MSDFDIEAEAQRIVDIFNGKPGDMDLVRSILQRAMTAGAEGALFTIGEPGADKA